MRSRSSRLSMSGEIFRERIRQYYAPENAPTDYVCRRILIPNDGNILAAVSDVLVYLSKEGVWFETDNVPEYMITALMAKMWLDFTESKCMIGSIIPVVLEELPDWMLPCAGGTFNRVDYPVLYSKLHPSLILDADTFKVPDLRGQFVLGEQTGTYDFGDTGGEAEHTLTVDEMPEHSHTNTPHAHSEITATATTIVPGELPIPLPAALPGIGTTGAASVAIDNTGGGAAHNNLPPYTVLTYALIAR